LFDKWIYCIAKIGKTAWQYQWLQEYAYHIELGWWMFVVACCMAVLIALITVSYQAMKAAMSNPVNILKSE
jgi:putative ABC transport system permease protein